MTIVSNPRPPSAPPSPSAPRPGRRTARGRTSPAPSFDSRKIRETLRKQFNFDSLRPGQAEVIRSVLARENTLAIMPTGAGKSLCYQLPTLHFSGVTVVVSPLVSLMKDQHEKMREFGIEALEFNSHFSRREQAENLETMAEASAQLLYVTPEKFVDPAFLAALGAAGAKVDLVVIDEAHCVSQWGHDFRPAYLGLADAIRKLGGPTVLALTATATPAVESDIREQLKLESMRVFRADLRRDNLFFEATVHGNENEKKAALLAWVRENEGAGIVYVSTVRSVAELVDFFEASGVPALGYHGKMKPSERAAVQDEFMHHPSRLLVATNAFGMGIDKPNIRFVAHYHFPGSLEAYYQEAGRAGRDGEPARCHLFYLRKDKSTQALFIARKYPSADELRVVYAVLQGIHERSGEIERARISDGLGGVSARKVALLLGYLKNLEILEEKTGGRYVLRSPDLSPEALAAISDSYQARKARDQERLKKVITYAQTALCRWKTIGDYFADRAMDEPACGHCDNCLREAKAFGEALGRGAAAPAEPLLPIQAARAEANAPFLGVPVNRVARRTAEPEFRKAL